MTPPRPRTPIPVTPSRDDHETTSCPVCQRSFTPAGRQAYCSPRCRKTAFRRRHQDPPAAITMLAGRSRRDHAIYECPSCGQRQAGSSAATTAASSAAGSAPAAHARTARNQ